MPSAWLDEALDLFPHAQPYDIQRDFMTTMLEIISQPGGIGLMESPTGTGKTSSLLSAALAWQRSAPAVASEPGWIKEARTKHLECIPVGEVKRRKGEVERVTKLRPVRRIIFCSRTHTQLAQVMLEVERMVARRAEKFPTGWQAVALAGRKSLCLQQKSFGSGLSQEALNERCLELQATPGGCPFNPASGLGPLEQALQEKRVIDVEEAVREGRTVGCCSYYGLREASKSASFLALPYVSLFQPETREAFGLSDLKGCLVIVDEAHNLLEALNEMASSEISLGVLANCVDALQRYVDRYGGRLAPNNRTQCQLLLSTLSQLHQYLRGLDLSDEKVMQAGDLLALAGIDHVNVHPIVTYVRDSHLSPKLTTANLSPSALSNATQLLQALYSADREVGRVLISRERIKFISLNPARLMADLLSQVEGLILAGGTMQPVKAPS